MRGTLDLRHLGHSRRSNVPCRCRLSARPPVPVPAQAAGRQQTPAVAGSADRAGHHLSGRQLALLPRRPAVVGFQAGPCGQSRETVRRSELAGAAAYGDRRSTAAFWASGSNCCARPTECRCLRVAATGSPRRRPSLRLARPRPPMDRVRSGLQGPTRTRTRRRRTVTGVCGRVSLRLLALAAGLIDSYDIGDVGARRKAAARVRWLGGLDGTIPPRLYGWTD
jgi:hypothetical protein